MNRIRHFGENVGLWGRIKLGLFIIVLVYLIVVDLQSRLWMYAIPVLVLMFFITYLIRDQLVKHHRAVGTMMNRIVIAAIIARALLRGNDLVDELWLNVLVIAFIGAYLGCYFWLLSDERLVTEPSASFLGR